MSDWETWRRYQEWLYYDPSLELYLDLSCMGLTGADLATRQEALQRAMAAMADLEQGAIANPDESRMVGHYWLRAPELAPTVELRTAIEQGIAQVESFAAEVRAGRIGSPDGRPFSDVLCIGIGGSALGPQLMADALAGQSPPLGIDFMDNTDPAGIQRVLGRLRDRLDTTLVVVTSKSGATPETRNGMLETQAFFERVGLTFARHGVAITGANSQLDQLARSAGWLARFPMHDWVGGRTSVLSAVGLLPAALQGIDIRALLAGARLMDEATRREALKANPAALLALAWFKAGDGRGGKDMVVLPYQDQLQLFGRYLQQLVMESLGKARDLDGALVHQGLAVYGNKGSTDQHAYVQQLRDGLENFFVTFVEVLEATDGGGVEVEPGITSGDYLFGFLEGTRRALSDGGRLSVTLTLPRVDARSLGALIALFERAVGLYATLINVNAYHQPGVEAGKRAAAEYLKMQQRLRAAVSQLSGPLTIAELADQLGTEEVEAVYKILRHLAATGRDVQLQGDPGELAQLQVVAADR